MNEEDHLPTDPLRGIRALSEDDWLDEQGLLDQSDIDLIRELQEEEDDAE